MDDVPTTDPDYTGIVYVERGWKKYELSNHLGNVLTVITDRRSCSLDDDDSLYYEPDIVTITDYYPFGSPMGVRTEYQEEYRFGFNGQERDDDVAGTGNINTALFWEYDARLGRRWNLDPKGMTDISEYSCLLNNPIITIDMYGDTSVYFDTKGNHLFTSYDHLENAIVILEDNTANALKYGLTAEGKKTFFDFMGGEVDYHNNAFNKILRQNGLNFMINDMLKFFNDYKNATPAKYYGMDGIIDDRVKEVSYRENSDEEFKPIQMYSEYGSNLYISKNIVRIGSEAFTEENATAVNGNNIPIARNKIYYAEFHLHVNKRGEYYFNMSPFFKSVNLLEGPSWADQNRPNENYNIMIDANNIYIYTTSYHATNRDFNITVPKSTFKGRK